jgi:antitoxin (DNA-binding transcriptional repressor) of toxin-antitoxin stability system
MTQLNLPEAKAQISALARRVKAGETIILCERNRPFAEIRPLPHIASQRPKRRLGQLAGACVVPPDFNAPDPAWEDAFHGGPIFPAPAAKVSDSSAP